MEFFRGLFRKGKNGKEPEGPEPVRVLLGLRRITVDQTLFDIRDSVILEVRDLLAVEKRAIEMADKVILEKVYNVEEVTEKEEKDA